MSSSPSTTGRASDATNFDLFGLILRKFWIILFMVLFGAGLGMLFFFKAPKTFQSRARIFVQERNPVELSSSDNTAFTEDSPVQEYIDKLKSEKVLRPVIRDAKVAGMESMKDVDNVLKALSERLSVKPADTKASHGTIVIRYDSPVEEECQVVVQAVCDSFEKYMLNSTTNVGEETKNLIADLTTKLNEQYEALSKEILEIKSNNNLIWREGKALNPHQVQIANLQEDLDTLRRERTKTSARLQNIKEAIAKGAENRDALLMEVLKEINEGSLGAYVTTHNEYVQLRIKEQELLNEYGADHPTMIALRNQIAMVDKMRMQELSALRGNSGDRDTPPDFVSVFVAHLEGRIKMMETEEKTIRAEMKEEQDKGQDIVKVVEKLYAAEKKRDVLEQTMFASADRLQEINLLKEYKWFEIEQLDEPTAAEQIAPNLILCGAAGVFIGTLFGFALALLIELAEKRLRSSEEVANVFGQRVVAHVQNFSLRPPRNKDYPGIGAELVSLHRPNSAPSEAYRSLRTSVFFKAQEKELKTIQVTSPIPGDGKSTTACNLANVIANAGRTVILIDCDFRRPVVHKMFGLKNEVGVTSVISGEISLDRACQSTAIENLAIMTSGPICSNPAELLTSQSFKNLLAQLEKDFDFIVVDTPPLMAVTDPSIVANNMDGVYVVTRIRNGVRVNAKGAREILDSVNANLLGVVINAVEKKSTNSYSYDSGYAYSRYGASYSGNSKPANVQHNEAVSPSNSS